MRNYCSICSSQCLSFSIISTVISPPGFTALHEDIDSPKPVRHTELTSRRPKSGHQPPLVSVEDLSSSASSLSDTQKEKLQLHIDKAEE